MIMLPYIMSRLSVPSIWPPTPTNICPFTLTAIPPCGFSVEVSFQLN